VTDELLQTKQNTRFIALPIILLSLASCFGLTMLTHIHLTFFLLFAARQSGIEPGRKGVFLIFILNGFG